jgi:hypothetical protein
MYYAQSVVCYKDVYARLRIHGHFSTIRKSLVIVLLLETQIYI